MEGIDNSLDIDSLSWWKSSEITLPVWAAAAKKVLVVQPSVAAVERVFLNTSFEACLHKCELKSALKRNPANSHSIRIKHIHTQCALQFLH